MSFNKVVVIKFAASPWSETMEADSVTLQTDGQILRHQLQHLFSLDSNQIKT